MLCVGNAAFDHNCCVWVVEAIYLEIWWIQDHSFWNQSNGEIKGINDFRIDMGPDLDVTTFADSKQFLTVS